MPPEPWLNVVTTPTKAVDFEYAIRVHAIGPVVPSSAGPAGRDDAARVSRSNVLPRL